MKSECRGAVGPFGARIGVGGRPWARIIKSANSGADSGKGTVRMTESGNSPFGILGNLSDLAGVGEGVKGGVEHGKKLFN